MMALVIGGVADIAIGEFAATSERANVASFVDTVEFSRYGRLV
jgi:hypothetical protein